MLEPTTSYRPSVVALAASGLIAGEALVGLLVAGVVAFRSDNKFPQLEAFAGIAPWLAIPVVALLAAYLIYVPLGTAGAADEPAPEQVPSSRTRRR